MAETSDHLKILILKTLIEKPYLRPYFYDNKSWAKGRCGDVASLNAVMAMAELVLNPPRLNNFASAIIHSAVFPQYPVRGVESEWHSG